MLEELGLGGELFTVLQNHGALPDASSRFYVASVVAMFSHLHALKIIYRDLKPENLLLDESGYLLLVDFGMAKLLNAEDERTWTVCGTPEYMAPEVVKHKFGCKPRPTPRHARHAQQCFWWRVAVGGTAPQRASGAVEAAGDAACSSRRRSKSTARHVSQSG